MNIPFATFSQHLSPGDLPACVRNTLGQSLRRSAAYTQLLACGAFSLLPPVVRTRKIALLWQSSCGPRMETTALLAEVCDGSGEPMPYDFLATQPAIAAAQLQSLLPGLALAQCCPLDSATTADWQLLLLQASGWLRRARYEHVLCAHIDLSPDACTAHWLRLDAAPLENCAWHLNLSDISVPATAPAIADTPDLPAQLVSANTPKLALHSRHSMHRTVEFVRSQPVR